MSKDKIRVLVVDDSALVRQTLSQVLSTDPMIEIMATASDPFIAAERMNEETPDVITLDIEMPRMDGYELMATIRSQNQYRQLPLIVLTSRSAAKHQQRATQLGADEYVVKPYQDDELIEKIDTLIQAKSQR